MASVVSYLVVLSLDRGSTPQHLSFAPTLYDWNSQMPDGGCNGVAKPRLAWSTAALSLFYGIMFAKPEALVLHAQLQGMVLRKRENPFAFDAISLPSIKLHGGCRRAQTSCKSKLSVKNTLRCLFVLQGQVISVIYDGRRQPVYPPVLVEGPPFSCPHSVLHCQVTSGHLYWSHLG